MKRYGRARDQNEPAIVAALKGFPQTSVRRQDVPTDLLVGHRGRNLLLEVKVPGSKLTLEQEKFFAQWPGQAAVVETPEQAILILFEATHGK